MTLSALRPSHPAMALTTTLLLPLGAVPSHTRWFSLHGCVVRHDDGRRDVLVGGTIVGCFTSGELAARDLVLATLYGAPGMHLRRLSEAFELSQGVARSIRVKFEKEGVEGLWNRRPTGRPSPLNDELRARLIAMFDRGLSISDAHQQVSTRRRKVSRATVGRVRQGWDAQREVTSVKAKVVEHEETSTQLSLADAVDAATVVEPKAQECVHDAIASEETSQSEEVASDAIEVRGGAQVQHVGAWILLAMVARLGLHTCALEVAKKRIDARRLRLALDTVIIALAIGEPTVEGARRLATDTAPKLLLSTHAPTPKWVRSILGRFSNDLGALLLHWKMLQRYVASAPAEGDRPAVFYVDNHLRRYTGQETVRHGWRMQDKRAVPGISDYYLHDEDGRPLWRVPVAEHSSLAAWLSPIVLHLRLAFGDDEPRIMMVFDRAGAFAEAMTELREDGIDFVTYERRPYPTLFRPQFDKVATIGKEKLRYRDARTNLGKGRGRVRRISVLTDDDRQVNILAVSTLPAPDLITILRNRWRQENGFKHGVERWGFNQLDGRTTEPYPAGAVMPNPARRRLDRAIRLLTAREGYLRCELVRMTDAEKIMTIEASLAEVVDEREQLVAQRPQTPTHALVEQTDLAGKLVQHTPEYKTTIDSVRIACANAEGDLAAWLGPFLPRPAEAKKLLASVFRSPGRVRVGAKTITVHLSVAATARERVAITAMYQELNRLGLTLPGDPRGRRLLFAALED